MRLLNGRIQENWLNSTYSLLAQHGDRGRVGFEDQNISLLHCRALDAERLSHAIEECRRWKRLAIGIRQLEYRGSAAEVVRGEQRRNASAEAERSAVTVDFAAARIHDA